MTINLFDDLSWLSLRPLTFTRPVADLRIGILTIAEKWGKHLNAEFGYHTQDYLSVKYKALKASLFINGSICPDEALIESILDLKPAQALYFEDLLIAVKFEQHITKFDLKASLAFDKVLYHEKFVHILYPEDIFKWNATEIREDFNLITKGRSSASLSSSNTFLGDNIFVEEGATAECAIFNSKLGPIYLGKNSEVWEGSIVRGSFALCDNSSLKMGSKIYSGTTVGPHSRVGGEVNNSVIWGYSSKGHEGYLGNSVLGQWCNIGADTNNSNLKNNYAEVKLWEYEKESFRKTGLQFCGLIMADHAKCGINTMFNTGTVAGVSANIFGAGFPRNFIPDFAWGGAHGFEVYALKKMFETAEKVYIRKDSIFNEIEKEILTKVFEMTEHCRHF